MSELLSGPETLALIKKAQGGDVESQNVLIMHNYGLIAKCARKMSRMTCAQSFSFDDLAGYGVFGMIDAIQSFQPDLHCRFSTLASLSVYRRIEKAVDKYGRVVASPRSQKALRRVSDHRAGDSDDSSAIVGNIPSKEPAPWEVAHTRERARAIAKALRSLKPQQRACVVAVMGGHPVTTVARKRGYSPSRASFLKREAFQALRPRLEKFRKEDMS